MRTSTVQRVTASIVTLNFLLTACTSLQGVPLPGADQPTATPAVNVGETVQVTTRAGETHRFEVTAVEADGLVGEDVRVPYQDMTSLQVMRSDPAQTGLVAWVIGGIVATAVLIWGIQNADEAADTAY